MLSILNFRPWSPRTWPSLSKLLTLTLSSLCLRLFSSVDLTSFNSLSSIAILFVIIAIKSRTTLKQRYEAFRIFDKGNIPSVPNKHPISGNLFEVIVPHKNIDIIHKYHEKLGKTYGIFYGKDPWVFTVDLELLHRIFVTDGNKYVDITQFRLPFMNEINYSLAQIQGDDWRRLRKMLNPSFAHRQMKSDNVYEDIERACVKILDCIARHPLESDHNVENQSTGRIIDVLYNFKKYAVEVIFQVAYGKENGVNMEPQAKDKLLEAIHAGSKQVRGPIVWVSILFEEARSILGYLAKITPIYTYIRLIHEVLDQSLAQRRLISKQIDKRQRKMIDSIIESVDTNKISEGHFRANLFFIFVAGFETSANTLAIMFWLLARHQNVQEKLREALASTGDQATYLDWCIQETLRLYPAVPTAIGRILSDTIHHKGQTFFKGTTINASINSIHHWPEYWGEDVETFRPERFGEMTDSHPSRYFAFGHGPRYCLGANLAMAEIRAIVPRLLLKYRVECCSTTPKELDYMSPNMIHMIIEGEINLRFTETSSL